MVKYPYAQMKKKVVFFFKFFSVFMETPMQVTKNSEKSTENHPNHVKNDYKLALFIIVFMFENIPSYRIALQMWIYLSTQFIIVLEMS